ncbi:hypothetical protein P7D43_22495 [Enterococcus avium]|jgi:hypothetical protein|uniref:DUF669 domain-containing protein n=1 Tax=Enterococcus avium TaxID=33945 RepID=A0AAW8S1R5_ENTAV|nr:hypothetical protein [Enterococcus avium]MBO1142452.1 hypothetical protein [Enterococcus avium]MDT2405135.1 hypothetical protein [Enterococcus avium]MDT2466641.1 hypothetical protein [Enterococcus avium]MDT2506099.1 hypothetical protein [Enterococcus avium]
MNNEENEFLGWGDSFIAEESTYTLLPVGEYGFKVIGFERKIYDGNSTKIQNGTPYAEIEMEFTGAEGTTKVFDRLYMVKKWQWKLTQFFTGIGQAPVIGQPFSPNWGAVVGSQGRAKLLINKYTKKDGSPGENNQIDEYLAPVANNGVVAQQPQQQNQPQQQGGFQPGAF